MKDPLIFYCQISYSDEFPGTKKCVDAAAPYVDYVIIVVEKQRPFTEEQKKELLKHNNVVILEREYKDNHPEFRNHYLEEAKKIAKEKGAKSAYVLVSDSDEFFNDKLLKDLRKIVKWMEENGYDIAGINCKERFEVHEWLDDLDMLKEAPWRARDSDFYKNLLFKLYPDLKYVGVGVTKNMHETFNRKTWRAVRLPKDKYWYEHVKSTLKIWRNAARNFFVCGGGDNCGDINPYWKPFKELCAKYGIHSWKDFDEALKKGLPEEIENKLAEFLQVPPTDYGTEMREMAKYYFALHPTKITPEIKEKIKNPPKMTPEIEAEHWVRQCYFMVFGRHPDRPGLEYWKWMILEGKVKKEELPQIFMQSEEYRRLQAAKGEFVQVQVPVDVRVHVSEDLFYKALAQSKTWWEIIKPCLDIGKFVTEQTGEEFIKWFYEERETGELTLEKFVEKLKEYVEKAV